LPGRRILADLGLDGEGGRAGPRRALQDSVHYRTAWTEREQARRDWSRGGPWKWEEITRERLADAGTGNP
jgi:hypothetical protein